MLDFLKPFSKRHLSKVCFSPSGNFPNLQFTMRQLPKKSNSPISSAWPYYPNLAEVLGPQCSLRRLWEVEHLGSCHLEGRLWEITFLGNT